MIENTFYVMQKVTEDVVTRQQFHNNLEMNDFELLKNDFDYMIMRLFRFSGDISRLPFKRIFDILEQEADAVDVVTLD